MKFDPKLKLAKNFTLFEAVFSNTAHKNKIDNTIKDAQVLINLTNVVNKIAQPCRDALNTPIIISSGYRCEALNKAVGGSEKSQHLKGEALDLVVPVDSQKSNKDIFDYIKNNLEFDQLIWEKGTKENPDWVHVSLSTNNNRKEVI